MTELISAVTQDPRRQELLDWITRTGASLPRPADEILALEDAGHGVDLRTGDILWNLATDQVALTVVGEAVAHIEQVEQTGGRP